MLKLNSMGNADTYWRSDNLNTSHVKVKPAFCYNSINDGDYLNTSHVKVKPKRRIKEICLCKFKYISC